MPRLQVGDAIEPMSIETLRGDRVAVPSAAAPRTHLQFRRFAGCPVCNLHLRSVARRHEEIRAAGVHEIAFFHSNAETMRPYQGDLPFDVVADPEKILYRHFGVESSLRAVADPRSWGSMLRGTFSPHASSSTTGEGGHLGLPADFLLDARGRVLASKYGAHADDQWSVDELLALAAQR